MSQNDGETELFISPIDGFGEAVKLARYAPLPNGIVEALGLENRPVVLVVDTSHLEQIVSSSQPGNSLRPLVRCDQVWYASTIPIGSYVICLWPPAYQGNHPTRKDIALLEVVASKVVSLTPLERQRQAARVLRGCGYRFAPS